MPLGKCRICRYWANPQTCDLLDTPDADMLSECRRHAPRLCGNQDKRPWPLTRAEDWCGDFEPRWGVPSCTD